MYIWGQSNRQSSPKSVESTQSTSLKAFNFQDSYYSSLSVYSALSTNQGAEQISIQLRSENYEGAVALPLSPMYRRTKKD